jgi:hypothetical protein
MVQMIAPYRCRYNQRPYQRGEAVEVHDHDVEDFLDCGWTLVEDMAADEDSETIQMIDNEETKS